MAIRGDNVSNAARQYDEAADLPPVGRVRFRNKAGRQADRDGMNQRTRAAYLKVENGGEVAPYAGDAPSVREAVYGACVNCGCRAMRNEAGEFRHPLGVSGRPRCQEPPELWG